ncbi:WD40-repeat-containing domain protein [Dipodascopsis tothii]|uniref:WD40-repeat-containing domain protein n=1 Tax=Dipodascopsis tothii TaxID=44089 RepID=UPI0034CDB546
MFSGSHSPPTPAPSPSPMTVQFCRGRLGGGDDEPGGAPACADGVGDGLAGALGQLGLPRGGDDGDGPMDGLVAAFGRLSAGEREQVLGQLLGLCETRTLGWVMGYVSPRLKKDPFRVLPHELCLRVLSHVDDPRTLARASQVSTLWYCVLADDITWKSLCEKHQYRRLSLSALADRPPSADADEAEPAPSPADSLMESTYMPVALARAQPTTYRSHFKQRYKVDTAWMTGGKLAARHITTDQGVVTCLHLTDRYIVVALDNSRIHVFSAAGRLLHTLTGHVMGVWAIMVWGDVLVSGGCDRDVRVWDLRSGRCRRVLRGHTSTVRCLKMSDATTAVSGSRDASLRVWDIETGECRHVLAGHQASVRCLEVEGDICVSGSYDTTAKVWSVSRGELLHTLTGHFSQIYALAFDGTRIATGSLDTSVRVWSAATGQCLAVLQGHTSLVGQLQMYGSRLVTGGSDGSVRVWDLRTMLCVHRLAAHDNSVTSLQFDSRRIVTGGNDGRVKVWDVATGQHIRDLATEYDAVWRVAFEDEKVVVLASRMNRTHMEVISFTPPPDEDVSPPPGYAWEDVGVPA